MQIKITMRYHLTYVTSAIIEEKNNKCWEGCGAKETLCALDGNVSCCTTMESNMKFHQKLKVELPYDPALPYLDVYPKKTTILT